MICVSNEKQYLSKKLAVANKKADKALAQMEDWSRREVSAADYNVIMEDKIKHLIQEDYHNMEAAHAAQRKFVHINVRNLQEQQLMDLTTAAGGCLSFELATRIKRNPLLHWIVTHPYNIARASFLTGGMKICFEEIEKLDITEMRAIAYQLPGIFKNDKDGKKKDWRARFFARLRQLVDQEAGAMIKGAYDLEQKKRTMVPLPPLNPEQKRSPEYCFITVEKARVKTRQYTDRIALLERRESKFFDHSKIVSTI